MFYLTCSVFSMPATYFIRYTPGGVLSAVLDPCESYRCSPTPAVVTLRTEIAPPPEVRQLASEGELKNMY